MAVKPLTSIRALAKQNPASLIEAVRITRSGPHYFGGLRRPALALAVAFAPLGRDKLGEATDLKGLLSLMPVETHKFVHDWMKMRETLCLPPGRPIFCSKTGGLLGPQELSYAATWALRKVQSGSVNMIPGRGRRRRGSPRLTLRRTAKGRAKATGKGPLADATRAIDM